MIDPTNHSDTLSCGQQLPCVSRSKSWTEHRFPDVSEITTLSGVTQVYGSDEFDDNSIVFGVTTY